MSARSRAASAHSLPEERIRTRQHRRRSRSELVEILKAREGGCRRQASQTCRKAQSRPERREPRRTDTPEMASKADVGHEPRCQLLSATKLNGPVGWPSNTFVSLSEYVGDDQDRPQRERLVDPQGHEPVIVGIR